MHNEQKRQWWRVPGDSPGYYRKVRTAHYVMLAVLISLYMVLAVAAFAQGTMRISNRDEEALRGYIAGGGHYYVFTVPPASMVNIVMPSDTENIELTYAVSGTGLAADSILPDKDRLYSVEGGTVYKWTSPEGPPVASGGGGLGDADTEAMMTGFWWFITLGMGFLIFWAIRRMNAGINHNAP